MSHPPAATELAARYQILREVSSLVFTGPQLPCTVFQPPMFASLLFLSKLSPLTQSAALSLLAPRHFYGDRLPSSHILEDLVLLWGASAAQVLVCVVCDWVLFSNGCFRRIANRVQPVEHNINCTYCADKMQFFNVVVQKFVFFQAVQGPASTRPLNRQPQFSESSQPKPVQRSVDTTAS